MATLGAKIKRMRINQGISQADLSKKCNLRQATISRLEADKVFQLKSQKLASLARALNVSTDFLVGSEERPKPEEIIMHDEIARGLITAYSEMDPERRSQLRKFVAFLNQG